MFNKKNLIFSIIKKIVRTGIVVLGSVLIILFLARDISKISSSLKEQRTLSAVLEKRNQTLTNLSNDFKIVNGSEEKIEKAFPPQNNILDFVGALEAINYKPSLQSLTFDSPTNSKVAFNINFNNNITDLINYLKSFERLPYFTFIKGINLIATNGNWTGDSSISLVAEVYTK